jgi:hypothetical protein
MRSRLLLVALVTVFGFSPGIAGASHGRRHGMEAQLTVQLRAQRQRIEHLQRQIRALSGAEPAAPAAPHTSTLRRAVAAENRQSPRTMGNAATSRPYRSASGRARCWKGSQGSSAAAHVRRAPWQRRPRTGHPPGSEAMPHVKPVPPPAASAGLNGHASTAQRRAPAQRPPGHNTLILGTPGKIAGRPTSLPPAALTHGGGTVPGRQSPGAREPVAAGERSVSLVSWVLLGIVALLGVYTLRHYYFTINRLFGIQRHPYIDVDTADWPTVAVFVDARGDEAGGARTLGALMDAQYPPEKLRIRVAPPPATGRAREMLGEFADCFEGRLTFWDRTADLPSETVALSAAAAGEDAEILLFFAAGCVPGRGLIKQLVAPFFDPEVGAVMGRPVTANVGSSLLTRLLDLELSGGYQVDQQASMNWDQVVRVGGPVGGVRCSALESIGGCCRGAAASDVDLACRLLLKGWKTVYENRAECYENVPESWSAQARRVTCCAWEYHRALTRHGLALLGSRQLGWGERWEGLLQLGSYAASLLLMVAWLLALGLLYLGANPFHALLALLAATWFGGLGSTPTVFGIAAAARLDGHRRRIRLLPLHILYALVSLVAVAGAAVCRPRRAQHPRTADPSEAGLRPQEYAL